MEERFELGLINYDGWEGRKESLWEDRPGKGK